MKDMDLHPMHEAIKKRKGNTLDLSIMVVPDGKDTDTSPNDDLAPKAQMLDQDQERNVINAELAQQNMVKPEQAAQADSAMETGTESGNAKLQDEMHPGLATMSDYEKNSIMTRPPRSLGDRVKFAQMQKLKH